MENKRNAIALPHIGRAIATTFLFIFILCTTCFATVDRDITRDFFQSTFEYFNSKDYGTNMTRIKTATNYILNTTGMVADIYNHFETFQTKYSLDLEYQNVGCFLYYTSTEVSFYFVVSNSTAPGDNDLGFPIISQKRIDAKNDNGVYNIYYFRFKCAFAGSSSSVTSTSYTDKHVVNSGYIFDSGSPTLSFSGIYNNDLTTFNCTYYYGGQGYVAYVNYPITSTSNYYPMFLYSADGTSYYVEDVPDDPDNPGTDDPDNPGTDDPDNPGTGGSNVDLSNIESGIDNLNTTTQNIDTTTTEISNKIDNIETSITEVPTETIENTEITADDLTEAVGVEFESDPYQNMWTTLTSGLSNALTGTNRTITTSFRNTSYTIDLDNFAIQLPQAIKPFLQIITTVFLSWKMFKYIKEIIDKISSGNIDKVLEMNEEEGIVDLF